MMEPTPIVHGRGDDAMEGSTVQRPVYIEPHSLGSTASLQNANLADASPLIGDDDKTIIRRPETDYALRTPPPAIQATPASVASVLLGTRLNHFLLEELIGGGGMGAVFRARDERLDRTVAIKVIPYVGEDPDLQRRFRNEAQNAARLDHPYIARVFDVGQVEQWHYIVFEHVEGVNIRDLIARQGVLSIDDAVYYTRQIAEAIEHADGRGIVHRDIKPSNVLVDHEGNVKVVDMGLARGQQVEVSGDMTASGVTLGTFDYISPEQARDPRLADVRSDIYSLGCTLYFMLTASPPYPGGTMLQKLLSHGNAPPPDPRGLRPEVSDNLTAIIHKMLAKDPAVRYPHALDLVADLRELAVREGLVRAQSRGTITIAQSDPLPQAITQHLPWIVAVGLLLMVAAWLQIASLLSAESFLLTPPENAKPLRSESIVSAPPIEPSSAQPKKATTVADAMQSIRSQPSSAAIDEAAMPPTFSDIAGKSDSMRSPLPLPISQPSEGSSRPTVINKIVVGKATAADAMQAKTLREALQLAEENKVTLIEIADTVLESQPVVINTDGLTIRSAAGRSQLRFDETQPLSMQRLAMIDIGQHRVSLEQLDLTWTVRDTVIDGGALLRVATNNRDLRMSDCTMTVENLRERDEVFAIEVADLGNDGPVQPLLTIDFRNVAARGEMSFLNLVDATQLDLNWNGGLVVTSGRFIEIVGASTTPANSAAVVDLELNRMTCWNEEGFARTRLGPSGEFPLVINRTAQDSVFHTAPYTPLVRFDGLSGTVDPASLIRWRGTGNAYDVQADRDAVLLYLAQDSEQIQVFRFSNLSMDRPAWFSEEAMQSVVRWREKPLSSSSACRVKTDDFIQEGNNAPGPGRQSLPRFP